MGDAVSGFIKGFMAGWEMVPSKSEREYEAAKTRYTNAMAKYYEEGGKSSDTTVRDANYNSQISDRSARTEEMIRHNKAMEANALKPRPKAEEAELEIPDSELTDDGSLNEDIDTTDAEVLIDGFNKGGPVEALPTRPRMSVKRYANGGGVVGEEEMVDPQPAVPLSQGAIPMAPGTQQLAPEVQQPAAPQMNQPTAAAEESPGFSYMAAFDAAKVGLEGAGKESAGKAKAIPGPGEESKGKDAGATVEEIKAMDPIVDKNRQLSESQRNAKKLAWGYEHYLQKGDTKRAKEYAVSMVKTFQDLRNRFNTIAAAKADQGDVDGAIGAALRAYAYVPDGLEVKLQKTKDGRFAYSYTDNVTGKTISKGLKTPEEMLSIITAGAASSMEDLVARASDIREKLAPDVAEGVVEGKMPKSALNLDEAKAIGATKARRDALTDRAAARGEKAATDKIKADAKAEAEKDKAAKTATKDAEKKAAAETKAAAKYTRDAPASPVSQMDFDALPGGAWFINPADGKLRQKKKAAAPAAGE